MFDMKYSIHFSSSINFTSSTSPVVSSVSCAGWEEHLIDCPFSLNDCQDEIVTLECCKLL